MFDFLADRELQRFCSVAEEDKRATCRTDRTAGYRDITVFEVRRSGAHVRGHFDAGRNNVGNLVTSLGLGDQVFTAEDRVVVYHLIGRELRSHTSEGQVDIRAGRRGSLKSDRDILL